MNNFLILINNEWNVVNENSKLVSLTKIKFNCIKCNKIVLTEFRSYKNNLCRTCKTKKTNLKKYGNLNGKDIIRQKEIQEIYPDFDFKRIKQIIGVLNE